MRYPLNWFIGWAMIMFVFAAFIVTMAIVTRGNSEEQRCLAAGGSWSHTLSQPESHWTRGHYDDTCTMPGKR